MKLASFQQAGDKAKAFFHHRIRSPRHLHLPQNKSRKCSPRVRYKVSGTKCHPCLGPLGYPSMVDRDTARSWQPEQVFFSVVGAVLEYTLLWLYDGSSQNRDTSELISLIN
jgi:hypothetical protein